LVFLKLRFLVFPICLDPDRLTIIRRFTVFFISTLFNIFLFLLFFGFFSRLRDILALVFVHLLNIFGIKLCPVSLFLAILVKVFFLWGLLYCRQDVDLPSLEVSFIQLGISGDCTLSFDEVTKGETGTDATSTERDLNGLNFPIFLE
jgi:hypothetical protein